MTYPTATQSLAHMAEAVALVGGGYLAVRLVVWRVRFTLRTRNRYNNRTEATQ